MTMDTQTVSFEMEKSMRLAIQRVLESGYVGLSFEADSTVGARQYTGTLTVQSKPETAVGVH